MMISQSVLSTQYVGVIIAAEVDGVPYNPTSDVVKFAFIVTGNPGVSDWHIGVWSTIQLNQYVAQCLVGPTGGVVLPVGAYTIWVQIVDNPEIPIRAAGTLSII